MLMKIKYIFLVAVIPSVVYGQGVQYVFDPSNFEQAVKSVANLREQVKTSRRAVMTMMNVQDEIMNMRSEMAKVYNSVFGVMGEIKQLKDELEKTPGEFQAAIEQFKKDSECVFSDVDAYQKTENMWNARYFYGKDPEKIGEGLIAKELGFNNDVDSRESTYTTLEVDPEGGLYLKKRVHRKAGTNQLGMLVKGKCALVKTYYDEAMDKLKRERGEFNRINSRYMKNLDEDYKKLKDKEWEILADRVSGNDPSTEGTKGTLDTQMMLQWQMLKILHRIDKNLEGIYLNGINLHAKQKRNVRQLQRAAKLSLTEQQIRDLRAKGKSADQHQSATPNFDALLEKVRQSKYYKRYDSGPLFK